MKIILFIFILFIGKANCNEIEYPDWYCDTYENKHHFYSCGFALNKEDSISNSINNISDFLLGKLYNEYIPYKMVYQKYDLMSHKKNDKYYFTKISLNKSELTKLYQIKLNKVNYDIISFLNKDISPIIKYKNKEKLTEYIFIMKHYMDILNYISNPKIDLSSYINILNLANEYLLNTKLTITILYDGDNLGILSDFLKDLFKSNGFIITDNSENVLYITLKNRKEFINNLYYINSNFNFKLFYKNSLQFYNYINFQNNSEVGYNDALKKIVLQLKNMIKNKEFLIM